MWVPGGGVVRDAVYFAPSISRIRLKWPLALTSVAGALRILPRFTVSRWSRESSRRNVEGEHPASLPYFIRVAQCVRLNVCRARVMPT